MSARVLLVGPRYEDSFVDNVWVTLEAMGYEVGSVPVPSPASRLAPALGLMRKVAARVRGDRPSRHDVALLNRVRSWRPTLLLSLTWDVHPEVLQDIRHAGCRSVLWWCDPPANALGWGLANPEWDVTYVKEREVAAKITILGREVHLLHEAMNPIWHRPVASRTRDSLLIFGNFYGFRQALALRLLKAGVPLDMNGPRPPAWAHPDVVRRWTRRYIVRLDKSRLIGESMAVLNSFTIAEGNSLNCRAFETAGAGGIQLLEYRPIVSECFEPGKEVLLFSTFEELLDQIRRLERGGFEEHAIRAAAARRALAHHTYEHRLRVILRAQVPNAP